MTLGQVAEAVLVDKEQKSMDPGDQFRDVHDLLDLCSSFVRLGGKLSHFNHISLFLQRIDREHIASDADLVLRLAHSSVKEYILSDRTNIASLSMHRLTSGNAHRSIAEVCLIYLNQFNDQSLIWDENLRRHQFLAYAATCWDPHYDKIPAEEEDSVLDLLLTFIDTHHYGYAYRNWLAVIHVCCYLQYQTLAPLAALSSRAAPRAVRAVIEHAAEVHVTDDIIRESLSCASGKGSEAGSEAVVQVLLDAGARLNRAGIIDASSLSEALSRATRHGNTAVTELLISKGATAEKLDYSTVSRAAASQGKVHIVKLLLDCNTTNCNKMEAFHGALPAAITAKQRSIIQYLLERSAEIDIAAREDLYFATLQTAFFHRDDPTVQFLLSRAFRSEARDIRRAKIKVLDTSWTPRTKLVLLQILGARTDHPLLERNHERDYIPIGDAYWENAVEIEYTIREIFLAERKLLEEEELIEEAADLLQRIRSLSTVASSPTTETESDDMVETESDDMVETESDDMIETESDDMIETESDDMVETEGDDIVE